jgi:uncharacterized protein (TIGR03067 family)
VKAQFLTLAAMVLASLSTALAQDDAGKKEQAKLEGVWNLVSGEENGEAAPESMVRNLKLVFKGNQLTFKGDARLMEKATKLTFKIDPSTTPKCIDITIEAGLDQGTVWEGIYEVTGDKMKICVYVGGDKTRPVEFETKAGSNRALFVMKRDKP